MNDFCIESFCCYVVGYFDFVGVGSVFGLFKYGIDYYLFGYFVFIEVWVWYICGGDLLCNIV